MFYDDQRATCRIRTSGYLWQRPLQPALCDRIKQLHGPWEYECQQPLADRRRGLRGGSRLPVVVIKCEAPSVPCDLIENSTSDERQESRSVLSVDGCFVGRRALTGLFERADPLDARDDNFPNAQVPLGRSAHADPRRRTRENQVAGQECAHR